MILRGIEKTRMYMSVHSIWCIRRHQSQKSHTLFDCLSYIQHGAFCRRLQRESNKSHSIFCFVLVWWTLFIMYSTWCFLSTAAKRFNRVTRYYYLTNIVSVYLRGICVSVSSVIHVSIQPLQMSPYSQIVFVWNLLYSSNIFTVPKATVRL